SHLVFWNRAALPSPRILRKAVCSNPHRFRPGVKHTLHTRHTHYSAPLRFAPILHLASRASCPEGGLDWDRILSAHSARITSPASCTEGSLGWDRVPTRLSRSLGPCLEGECDECGECIRNRVAWEQCDSRCAEDRSTRETQAFSDRAGEER